MFLETTHIRLAEQQHEKLQSLKRQTGLNTSQILRILIESAEVQIKASLPIKNKSDGFTFQGSTVTLANSNP